MNIAIFVSKETIFFFGTHLFELLQMYVILLICEVAAKSNSSNIASLAFELIKKNSEIYGH